MNEEMQYKLQAWIDGELNSSDSAEVAEWVSKNPEAIQEAQWLRSLRSAMRSGESCPTVTESRETYWAPIERRIELLDEEAVLPANVSLWREWCRQWLVPAGGLAMLVAAFLTVGPDDGSVQLPGGRETRGSSIPAAALPAAMTETPSAPSESESEPRKLRITSVQINGDGVPQNPLPQDELRSAPSIENPDR